MANYTRSGSGVTQNERIGANNNEARRLLIESLFGYCYFAKGSNAQLLETDIRTTQESQPISDLEYSSPLTLLEFVVDDGSVFRVGETLQITTASGVHKGNVSIDKRIGDILYCTQINGSQTTQEIINTDLIVLPIDSIIAENGTLELDSSTYTYLIYQTENTDVKITFDTNLKKK